MVAMKITEAISHCCAWEATVAFSVLVHHDHESLFRFDFGYQLVHVETNTSCELVEPVIYFK